MILKGEIMNIYRHAKGLFESAERLARAEGVVRCPICKEVHSVNESHVGRIEAPPLIVEHKPKKSNTQ